MTGVGEFHYLHHQPDGTPYADPNAMSHALVAAAREAGIRLTLLDTCYLSAGFGEPPQGVQRRFSDGDVDRWARAASAPLPPPTASVPAPRSTRSAPSRPRRCRRSPRRRAGRPLHAHVSEQVAENDACVAAYARTPVEVLADHGVLGPLTTAVHATHLTDDDVRLPRRDGDVRRVLPDHRARPRRRHRPRPPAARGRRPADPRQRQPRGGRPVRGDARRSSSTSGSPPSSAVTGPPPSCSDGRGPTGHASLGWADAGAIAVGHRADLVTLDTASPRTAGTGADEHTAVFAATAADVVQVVVDGRVVVRQGDAEAASGRELDDAIGRIWT